MNHSTHVFLLSDAVRAIVCQYNGVSSNSYTFKSMDPLIKEGDFVAVKSSIDAKFGLTIAKVVEVDAQIDFDPSINYKWIVQRIDMDAYNAIVASEEETVKEIRKQEKNFKKEQLRKALSDTGVDLSKITFGKEAPASVQITSTLSEEFTIELNKHYYNRNNDVVDIVEQFPVDIDGYEFRGSNFVKYTRQGKYLAGVENHPEDLVSLCPF